MHVTQTGKVGGRQFLSSASRFWRLVQQTVSSPRPERESSEGRADVKFRVQSVGLRVLSQQNVQGLGVLGQTRKKNWHLLNGRLVQFLRV